MDLTLEAHSIRGDVTIPPSKSRTIRALITSCLSEGRCTVYRPLYSRDTDACIEAVRAFGAIIETYEDRIEIDATHMRDSHGDISIDCRNSGTTLYLILSLAVFLKRKVTFTGDEQLKRRPLGNLLDAYRDLGAVTDEHNYPPFAIEGGIKGGHTSIECPTSQYLSSLLLSAPLADNDVTIDAPLLYEKPYVSMTLEYLDRHGIEYRMRDDLQHCEIRGKQKYTVCDDTVTGDWSSASFFLCASAITGCTLRVHGLDMNDSQGDRRILDILKEMGCDFRVSDDGTIEISRKGKLKGGTFDLNTMPDALPILCATAACAEGTTNLVNVPQARIKETDRISAMAGNLTRLGIEVREMPDGISIKGGRMRKATVDGFDDHRIIMSMAILSLAAEDGITIRGVDAAAVTFPEFFRELENITVKS